MLVYWPVFFFGSEFVADRRRILQFVTPMRLLCALGIGAAASLMAYELTILAPNVCGLLAVPLDYMWLPFSILTPIFAGDHFMSYMSWMAPVRLVGGCLAYGVIAFFVLYKIVWSKSGQK